MIDPIRTLAERRIQEAIDNGEFENLPGKGKPLPKEDSLIPPEYRMEYKILKNAGVLPEEMGVKREIEALETLLNSCRPEEQQDLRQKIQEKYIKFNLLMEKRRQRR